MTRYAEYRAAAARQAEAVLSRASHRAAGDYGMGGGSVAVGLSDAIGGQYIDSDAALLYQRNKGWVYSSIRPIARTVAGLRFQVGMRTASKPAKGERVTRAMKSTLPRHLKDLPGDVVLLENNPLLDVLARPNLLMVGWHLKYITVVNLELIGKAYWWLTLSAERKPVIWPLPVSWVTPLHENGKPFAKWRITPGGTGTPFTVDADEIVYFYYPDPANTLLAKSPAGAQMRAIIADENIQEAQARAFSNGLWPGLAIIAGDVTDIDSGESQGRPLLEGEQRSQLTAMIRKHYASVTHFKEPLILDALIKDVKPLSNTPHEMDFLDSSTLSKSRVTQGHGVNPAIMGEIEGLNRASSHSARLHFGEFTVNPLAELISETLTATIGARMSPPGMQLLVYLESYRPDDSAETRADMQLLVNARAITRNELRMRLGNMPPMEGAGEDMVMMPTEQIVPITGIPPMAEEEPEEEEPEEEDDDDPDESGRSFLTRRRKGMSRERYVAEARRLWEEDQLAAETRVAGAVFTLFRQQEADIMQRLESLWSDVDGDIRHLSAETAAEMIFDPRAWTQRWRAALLPLAGDIAVTGAVSERSLVLAASKTIELIELDPQVVDAVNAEIETWMDRPYWGDVQATTRQQLVATLQEGFANGDSLYQLMTRIGDNPTVAAPPGLFGPGTTFGYNPILGSGPSTARASLIARSESTGWLNSGHQQSQEMLAQEGVIAKKEWSAILDQYTRTGHYAADGQKVEVSKPFMLSDPPAQGMYPGHYLLPAAHRCNCILPGQLVEGSFVAGTKARYSGTVAEIVTRSGRTLSLTPQHRVLTPHGFVAAGTLQKGQKIVAYQGQIDNAGRGLAAIAGAKQVHREPSLIEDVFSTIAKAGAASRSANVRRSHRADFDGDAEFFQSDVEVVWSERELHRWRISGDGEERSDSFFIGANLNLPQESRSGSLQLGVDGISRSATGIPRPLDLSFDGGAVALDSPPLQQFRIGSAAYLNARITEAAKKDRASVARFVRQLLQRTPADVFLDEVVEVRYHEFSGHVYDLQSESGLIICSGIAISNCRCTVLSVLNEHLDPGKPRRSARRLTYA